jgi:hypothetical protein
MPKPNGELDGPLYGYVVRVAVFPVKIWPQPDGELDCMTAESDPTVAFDSDIVGSFATAHEHYETLIAAVNNLEISPYDELGLLGPGENAPCPSDDPVNWALAPDGCTGIAVLDNGLIYGFSEGPYSAAQLPRNCALSLDVITSAVLRSSIQAALAATPATGERVIRHLFFR